MNADGLLRILEDTTQPRALRRKLLEMYTHRVRLEARKEERDACRKLVAELCEERARAIGAEPGSIFRDLLKVP